LRIGEDYVEVSLITMEHLIAIKSENTCVVAFLYPARERLRPWFKYSKRVIRPSAMILKQGSIGGSVAPEYPSRVKIAIVIDVLCIWRKARNPAFLY
jgi:hypothetical protein